MSFLRQRFLPQSPVRVAPWLIVGLTILLVFTIRVRLRNMPLERDEGEYAYAGQLILQGVPPYKEAYNMKLPGTYAAYALIIAIFGQSASAIHVGVALVNAASILLIFLIGRKILDEPAGVVAAISYALLSTSQSVLGLAGHATHFIVLPALAGTLLLLRAREYALDQVLNPESNRREQSERRAFNNRISDRLFAFVSLVTCCSPYSVFLAGLLFGLAFLMKQHGIFFGIFGGLYLAFSHIYLPQSIKEKREQSSKSHGAVRRAFSQTDTQSPSRLAGTLAPPQRRGSKLPPIPWPTLFKELALFSAAFALPYLLTCLILWAAGVFPEFTFWTITYARKYATALPSGIGNDAVRTTLDAITGANVLLWIVPWLGAILLGWEQRLANEHRFLLIVLLICSFGSISVGFYFRQHYFITLLPIMALLTGLAVSRAIRLVKHDITIELFVAIVILLLFGVGCLMSIGGNGPTWFATSPVDVVEQTYGTTLFNEARKLAEYIRSQESSPGRAASGSITNSGGAARAASGSITNSGGAARAASGSITNSGGAGRAASGGADTTQPATPLAARAALPTIAILGSEPEIYFYSRRRSASGNMYMYPLMETHPYAAQMQRELISQIETNNPEYIIFVDYHYSWLGRPESSRLVQHWWESYSTNLDLVQTLPINPPADLISENPDLDSPSLHGHLLLYGPKRKR
jgi:4-amino-4-deoxy-L-arabinose transferase-like glycosyltransferase